MNISDEKNIDPVTEMMRIADDLLQLPMRGFKINFTSEKLGKLIYNSEKCRISLIWGGWDQTGGNNMHIRYGRLHAPNEKITMNWKSEECRCWHELDYVLHLLDGRTPAEASELDVSHSATDPFYETEFTQKFQRHQPEWLAQMQLTIWQQYGQRVFNLFDLRQPELWQQYRQFLTEVYDIQGRDEDITPPMDQVC